LSSRLGVRQARWGCGALEGIQAVALSDVDRKLLQRCLNHKPRAWEDFVDRFLGLVLHVIRHTAKSRSWRLPSQDEEDLAADFFLAVVSDDFAMLRRFRGESSLATYLTVVARRVIVRELLRRHADSPLLDSAENLLATTDPSAEERISDREEVERLLRELTAPEADVVRMYHLEGKTYREISSAVGMPENSIGPTLSRARAKLRRTIADHPV
jgi:RNA polymerase sigma-70 factor, ECF subfamily